MRMWPRSRVSRLEEQIEELRAGLANPSVEFMDAVGVSATFSGQKVSVDKALGLAAVWGAVNLIAEHVGMLPLKVYRKVDGERVEADSHRSWRMLHDKPNPATTADRFWSTVTLHLKLYGNAFLEKDRDPFTGEVQSLYVYDPARIAVEWDGRQKRFVDEGPPKRTWSEENMLHIMGLSLNGITGMSPITMMRNPLGTAMAREMFEGGFYKRGAKFPVGVEHPGRLGEQGVKNIREGLLAIHGGVENMHKSPVLEEGATFKVLQQTLEDMQFMEAKQMSRSDTAIMYGIPPSYLAASTGDSITYSTVEGNKIQLAQTAIMPTSNTISSAVSQDPEILPQPSMYAEFTLEQLLRADKKTQAEYWEKLHAMGVVSEAFIAEKENLPKPPPKPKPMTITPLPQQTGGQTSEPAPIIGNNGA